MREPGPIIIVCTANICRSPMGQGLLAHALAGQPAPLKNLKVISAGVAARTGELASENSVFALKRVGIDIAGHRSTALTQQLLDQALCVLVMTDSHKAMIEIQASPVPKNLHLFRDFLPKNARKEIGDPYGSNVKAYEACRDEMVEAIPSIIAYLKTLLPKSNH
jgi:protein-tyrosine-phosphatase